MSEYPKQYSDAGLRFIIAAACLVVVIAGLRAAAAVVLPFLVAVFFAIISVPLIGWLQKFKVPRAVAVFLTVLMAAGIIGIFGLVVAQSVNGFSVAAPHYQDEKHRNCRLQAPSSYRRTPLRSYPFAPGVLSHWQSRHNAVIPQPVPG